LVNISEEDFPRALLARGQARIVTLEPGQALPLPPEWLHFATSVTHDSISVAMRRDFDSFIQDTLRNPPLPFDLDWELSALAGTVRYFLLRILGTKDLQHAFASRLATAFRDVLQDPNCPTDVEVVDPEKCDRYAHRLLTLVKGLPVFGSQALLLLEYSDEVVFLTIPASRMLWFASLLSN